MNKHEEICTSKPPDIELKCLHCEDVFSNQGEFENHIAECSSKIKNILDLKFAPFPTCNNPECRGVVMIYRSERKTIRVLDDLLKTAKGIVKVQDKYISNKTLELLQAIPKGVEIQILTSFSDYIRNNQYLDIINLDDEFQEMINLGYELQIADLENPKVLHDRIIIVDDHAWAFSTSLKDISGFKGGIISYIPPSSKLILERMFNYYWDENRPISDTYLKEKAGKILANRHKGKPRLKGKN
ncbi:MAG: hypothetical protein ACTSWA_01725 [Candidatus Thorarchaeota archaeon]